MRPFEPLTRQSAVGPILLKNAWGRDPG